MKNRHVITEGQDDIAAFRAIAIGIWCAQARGGSADRRERLICGDVAVDLHFTIGESKLAAVVEAQVRQSSDKTDDDRLVVLFDPDVTSQATLEAELEAKFNSAALVFSRSGPEWSISVSARTILMRV